MHANDTDTIPLTKAAFELGVSYEIAKRLLLKGELEGEQVGGRWWLVTASSVDRVKQARTGVLTAAVA